MNSIRPSSSSNGKIDFIQSWRGIAVLLVVSYHFSNRVPPEYLDMAEGPSVVFHAGKIGVLIFFVISGYLITKSLTTSRDLGTFYAKRISRIWPLFILASLLIFLFLQFVDPPVVPDGPKAFFTEERSWTDLLGTIFFLEDFGFTWMDGVFWSILVELKFYFWIGLLAWFRPKTFVRDFAIIAVGLSLLQIGLDLFGRSGLDLVAKGLNGLFIAQYLPFFAIGALLLTRRNRELLIILFIIAIMQAGLKTATNPDFDVAQSALFIALLTGALIVDRQLFQSRVILHIGNYSYGFYLFHQVIGLSLIKMVGGLVGYDIALLFALLATYSLAVFASWLAEWRFRGDFMQALTRIFTYLRIDQMRLRHQV